MWKNQLGVIQLGRLINMKFKDAANKMKWYIKKDTIMLLKQAHMDLQ